MTNSGINICPKEKNREQRIFIDLSTISWDMGMDIDFDAYFKKRHKKADSARRVSLVHLCRKLHNEVEIIN